MFRAMADAGVPQLIDDSTDAMRAIIARHSNEVALVGTAYGQNIYRLTLAPAVPPP